MSAHYYLNKVVKPITDVTDLDINESYLVNQVKFNNIKINGNWYNFKDFIILDKPKQFPFIVAGYTFNHIEDAKKARDGLYLYELMFTVDINDFKNITSFTTLLRLHLRQDIYNELLPYINTFFETRNTDLLSDIKERLMFYT